MKFWFCYFKIMKLFIIYFLKICDEFYRSSIFSIIIYISFLLILEKLSFWVLGRKELERRVGN